MRKIVLICIMGFHIWCKGQESHYGGYSPSATTTPTAAKINGASGSNVHLATGAIQKYIPIHTINQGGVSWNTGLQYRYTGLQVQEEPSTIGLGWDLAGVGMVSREVRGLPDDHPKGYYGSENVRAQILDPFYNAASSIADRQTEVIKEHHAYKLAQGLLDGEPDLFRVNVGNLNVSFKLGDNLQPILLSHHNVKINFTWDRIEVVDSDGVTYVFAKKEIMNPQLEEDLGTALRRDMLTPDIQDRYAYTRSWYITEIRPRNTTQSIRFEYDTYSLNTYGFFPKIYSYKGKQPEFRHQMNRIIDLSQLSLTQQQLEHLLSEINQGETVNRLIKENSKHMDYSIYSHTRLPVEITRPYLKKITFATGSLHFLKSSVANGKYPRYTRIQLKDYHTKLIQTFDFSTQGNRNLLKQVKLNNQNMYAFDYYSETSANAIPSYQHQNNESFLATDFWGYYTGNTTEEDALTIAEPEVPNFLATRAGALQHIYHKTGGVTEIIYEPNQIAKVFDDQTIRATQTFSVESVGVGSDMTTRTFTTASKIRLSHSGKISAYGAGVHFKIVKHGYQGAYVPYYDCNNNNNTPQLDYSWRGVHKNIPDGQQQHLVNELCVIDITPGTYSFYVSSDENASAKITVEMLQVINNGITLASENYNYGGIRVKSIKNKAVDSDQILEKVYDYTTNTTLSSAKVYNVTNQYDPFFQWYDTHNKEWIGSVHLGNFDRASYVGFPFYKTRRGLPIYYAEVSEYSRSSDMSNQNTNGKVVYHFDALSHFDSRENPLQYSNTAPKGTIENGIHLMKKDVYKSTVALSGQEKLELMSEESYGYTLVEKGHDTYGNSNNQAYPYGIKISSKGTIKRRWQAYDYLLNVLDPDDPLYSNKLFNLVTTAGNFEDVYQNGVQSQFTGYVRDLVVAAGFPFTSPIGVEAINMSKGTGNLEGNHLDNRGVIFDIAEYKETNAQYLRTSVTKKVYEKDHGEEPAESIANFNYDSNNQLTSQSTTTSKGDTQVTKYFYPYHTSINNSELVSQNRISAPVKTETFYNTKKQSTALVNFDSWNSVGYLPRTIQSAKENAPLLDQTIFHKYDECGNPLETSAREGIRTIYVWGYNHTTPIAVITNASYTGMPSVVKNLINTAITASDNDTNATTENQLRTALQNLRNHSYFASSQMVTYTYDPLIGMTSTTDVRNRTTYYEYDNLHRLKQVKDQDGNILSANEYNYKNN